MTETYFEPLPAMDRQFLEVEGPNRPMHVSGISEYELGPLRCDDGSLDFERIRKAIESVLHKIPMYRRKLAWTPIERAPGWIDAADFDLDNHLRHIALPAPGSESQLKQLTSLIVSLPLDPSQPLWEMWFIEGLGGGESFAVVTKIHHCMIDGGSGVNLLSLLLRGSPDQREATPKPWTPRPAPSDLELAAGELGRRLSTPLRMLRGARRFQQENPSLTKAVFERLAATRELLASALSDPPAAISEGTDTPHRRVDWLETSLEELTALRRTLGCTLNDLVLTVVTDALHRYLGRREVEVDGLDFRVLVPVNVRREEERSRMGNRVSTWLIRLPVELEDPLEQLAAIRRSAGEARESRQELGFEMLVAAAEEIPLIFTLGARASRGQVSTVVTNVPGPPKPLYLMGSRARTMQPFVLLPPGVGIAVAVLSYDGRLFWGFMADTGYVSDVDLLREDVRDALDALRERVASTPKPS